eukprot:scaffold200920_cov31-Tisochrysis_lutea.AAC.1
MSSPQEPRTRAICRRALAGISPRVRAQPCSRDELDISTLLDPRFKTYAFPGLANDGISSENDRALASLRGTWSLGSSQLQLPALEACVAGNYHGGPGPRVPTLH